MYCNARRLIHYFSENAVHRCELSVQIWNRLLELQILRECNIRHPKVYENDYRHIYRSREGSSSPNMMIFDVGSIIVIIYNNVRSWWFGPGKGQKSELTYETRCSFDEPGKPLRFGSAPTCQTKSRKKRKLMDISSSGRIVIRKTVAP
jgi:hypothetical protein